MSSPYLAPGKARRPLSILLPVTAFVLSLGIALIVTFVDYIDNRGHLLEQQLTDLQHESQLLMPLLGRLYEQSLTDVLFLSNLPVVQDIINASPGEARQLAPLKNLSAIFEQLLLAKNTYTKIRLIDTSGQEQISLVRQEGSIRQVGSAALQNKAQRDYHKSTLQYVEGSVYFSRIGLNREHGKVSIPHLPVLRVATPIYGADDNVYAIIIISVDFGKFIRQLKVDTLKDSNFFLANQEGDFLVHPDRHKTFGFDLGKRHRLQDSFPAIANFSHSKQQALPQLLNQQGQTHRGLYRQLDYYQYGNQNPLQLLLLADSTQDGQLNKLRNHSVILALSLALISLLISLLLARRLTHSLSEMTEALHDYDKSGISHRLPVTATDETGVLARSFHNLLGRLDEKTQQQKIIFEENLAVSTRMQAILNSASDAIITLDPLGKILSFNRAAKTIFGYREEEILQQNLALLLEEKNLFSDGLENHLLNHDLRVERIAVHKNGKHLPIILAITRVSIKREDLYTAIIRDISQEQQLACEREAALAEVKESNWRMQFALKAPGIGIWELDLNTRELTWDKRMFELYGASHRDSLSPEDIWSQRACADDMQQAQAAIELSASQGEDFNAEFNVRWPDSSGHLIASHGMVKLDSSGKPQRLVGTDRDITATRQLELERQESLAALNTERQRLSEIIWATHAGTWEWNLETGETVFNEVWANICGYRLEELQPYNIDTWTNLCHPDDRKPSRKLLRAHFNGDTDYYECEARMRHKDGHWIWGLGRGKVVEWKDDGSPLRMSGTHQDISAQKSLMEDREQALAQANESTELKASFLASMSHEIRTPMNGVLGMLNLLQRAKLTEQQQRYVSLAHSSAGSLLTLINDILDFSKVEAGKLELENIDFDLRSQLGEFAETMALRAQEKDLEVILDLTRIEQSMVMGDPSRLRQILTNLVSNAIKFTSQGEIVIRAGLKNAGEMGLILYCSVSDTGIGISKAKQPQLFDAFTQVDASTTREYGGSGLGLAIVKQLCELMHGSIGVSSREGHGSCFEFSVTLQPSEQSVRVMPSVSIKDTHILIVDDNATNRLVLHDQLQHWGARVSEAADGASALALLNQQLQDPFPIAILDMQMPGMNGAALGRAIRADQRFDNMRLIMMTSMAERGDARYFAELGFAAYFSKPTTTSDLFNALAVVLEGGEALTSAKPLVTHHHLHTLHNPEQALRPDARLLLVEDNSINQEVALGILRELGYSADVSNNGQEACDALRRAPADAPYELILMDCQMPIMDGYQATETIRNNQHDSRHRKIPIIAMTANAMKGDREHCLAAGMSDYLSKPVDPEQLLNKLNQWLGDTPHDSTMPETEPSAQVEQHAETVSSNASAAVVIWDRDRLLKRVGGKEKRLRHLLGMFTDDMPQQVASLQQAIADQDTAKSQDLAHAIKGVVANLGGLALQPQAAAIEIAAKTGTTAEAQALWPEFERAYQQLHETIATYMARPEN